MPWDRDRVASGEGMNRTKEQKSQFLANLGCLIIVLILSIPILFGIRGCAAGINPTYEKNMTVIGIVTTIGEKGYFWTCYEGHCYIGAYADNINAQMNMNAHSWDFSVTDPEVAERVRALSGKRVKMTYNTWWSKPIYQDTGYTVIGIEEDKGK